MNEPRAGWRLILEIGGERYAVRSDRPLHLSIPLDFHGTQPQALGLPGARAEVFRCDGFIGDVREKGSCNIESVSLAPHGNGTHTEGVGHLTAQRLPVHSVLRDSLVPCTVATVVPERLAAGGSAITSATLRALELSPGPFLRGLVLRTKPNEHSKKSRTWTGTRFPHLAPAAARDLRELGVCHLVTDLPSLDPEGALAAHRAFWDVAGDTFNPLTRDRTVTELAFVDPAIPDGRYLLNLQIAPFVLDAAPARPVLFEVQPI